MGISQRRAVEMGGMIPSAFFINTVKVVPRPKLVEKIFPQMVAARALNASEGSAVAP